MTAAPTKPPRFKRQKPETPMTITSRDLDIVETVWRYRCIDAVDIAALVGGSAVVVNRRLRLLFDNGYLDRPVVQIQWQVQRNNPPLVYLLGRSGARLLEDYGRAANLPSDWTAKNHSLKPGSILHMNAIAGVMVAFERLGKGRFIREETLLDDNGKRKPLTWAVEIIHDGARDDVRISPDHAFGVRHEGRAAYFFLEADRSSMPLVRRNEKQSSILEKLEAYVATIEGEIHKSRYNMHAFRVLFSVLTLGRLQNMLAVVKDHIPAKYHRNFLFAVADELRKEGVEAYQFWNGRGERTGLLSSSMKASSASAEI